MIIGILASSTIIQLINPIATAQPTITYPDENGISPDYTPTPDQYTGTIDGLKVHSDNYNDSYGLTAGQKMDAILLALDNSRIGETINDFKNMSPNISVEPVTVSKQGIQSGYLNITNIVAVPMNFGDMFSKQYFIVYVDIQNHTVIGLENGGFRGLDNVNLSIPPGAYWYHWVMGPWVNASDDMSRIEMQFRVGYTPGDARLYMIVVNESNFEKFKNGSAFSPLTYVDYTTNQTTVLDGKKPVVPDFTDNGTSYWTPHISLGNAILPDYWKETQPRYYAVLMSGDSHTVQIMNFDLGP